MVVAPAALSVNVTEQLADAPVPDRVHGEPVNVPVPVLVQETVPVGVIAVPVEVSVTVAVHVVDAPTATVDGLQLTLVVVVRGPAVVLVAALVLAL
jgi:hypothetical protein